MSRKIYKPYFAHDIDAHLDSKIKKMCFDKRKISDKEALASFGLYWLIIQSMHKDDFNVKDIEVYADDFRVDIDFLKSVLDDYDLFEVQDGKYISKRVIRNIEEQEEKSKKAKLSQSKRKGKEHQEKLEDTEPLNEINIADVFVAEVIELFNQIFEKSQVVSDKNKTKIAEITMQNQLKLDDWEIIFTNAKRGWDYPDGKNIKPPLKKILEEWDSFRSDDYNLAEDTKAKELSEKLEKEAGKKLNTNIDNELFTYDKYRQAKNIVKLEAQKIYQDTLPQGKDAAIEAACLYCKSR